MSKELQSVEYDLNSVVLLYKSLRNMSANMRDLYDNIEENAKKLCNIEECNKNSK